VKTIRRLVYWMGFRPKYPSILFSPSLHCKYVVFPAASEGLLKGFDEGSGHRK